MPESQSRADWMARILLVLTWGVMGASWALAPRPEDPRDVLTHELHPPSRRDICPMPPGSDPTKLADVMTTGVSPLMSKISFQLNHDTRSDPEKRRETIVQATAGLLGCVQLAAANPPSSRIELEDHYVELMTQFRDTVALLQLSAIEGDGAASVHWFDHLRNDCARCHMLFKPGSN